ncbi:MAG: hypothetical protein ACK4S4_03105 [Pyrinomonadaceae bacterium]
MPAYDNEDPLPDIVPVADAAIRLGLGKSRYFNTSANGTVIADFMAAR